MTKSQKENLVEAMARAICSGHLEDPDAAGNNVADGMFFANWTRYKADARDALDAIERAGFRIEPP